MKRSKMLLVALLAMALSLFTACTTVVPHEHAHSDWEIIVAPTETENGLASRSCECGDVENVHLPALVDEFWTVTDTPSTHYEHGSLVYSSAYVDIVFEYPLVEDHEFGDWAISIDPTLDAIGSAVRVCPCGEEETGDVPALTDSIWTVTAETASTHFVKGSRTYTSIYGEVTIVLDLDPMHEYREWVITVDPTLEATGTATKTCDCGDVYVWEIPALSNEEEWTVTAETASTHFVKGSRTYTSTYGEVTIALDLDPKHVYGDWTITADPTLDAVGSAMRKCDCGDEEVVEVPALTDAIWTVADEKVPSHHEAGYKTYSSVYGEITIVLAMVSHDFGDWTITADPTLDAVGSAMRKCGCGDEEVVEVPALTDAVWTIADEVAPDYNVVGSRTYTSTYGEVTIEVAKLVAPYDNKTYSNIYYDAEREDYYYKNGVISISDVWSDATVEIDAAGAGAGTAYPFRGDVKMVMVDATVGAMTMTVTAPPDSQGEISVSVYNAYVDFATGIVIIPRTAGSIYNDFLLLTPFALGLENTVTVASAWDDAVAIDYAVDGACDVSIFIYKEVVYFGASFVGGADGAEIAADACYNAPYVYAYDKDGKLIEGFVFNGEKLVVSDKLEGTYTGNMGDVVISGYGVANVNGMDATYEICDGYLGVYVNGEYYEATVDGDVYTAVKPMVNVAFDAGELAQVDPVEANKNVAIELPVVTHERYTFKGWYLDADFTQAVEGEFIPTSDVTLYALWAEKVVVTLVGVLEGDNDTLYLGEGDVIGEFLPEYGVEESIMKRFVGWYLDANGENALTEDAEVSAEDSGVTIYAIWVDLPVYYGSYKGGNTYGISSGGSASSTIAIDGDGKITGKNTGTVVSYDPSTQTIVWDKGGTNYNMFYDEESGILTTGYSASLTLGTDYMVYTRYQTTAISHYAVKVAKTEGSSDRGYYARLVKVTTANGEVLALIYRDRIYSNVVVTDALGNELTIDTLKNSKTVVVKHHGATVLAIASQGNSFAANSDTVDLDEYFGTYVNGADTLVLDGAGSASLNGVVGTYAVAGVGSDYGFDVYLADGAEYYEVTLDGDSFTAVKPMVTITYEEGAYANIEDVSVNKNVVHTLPVLTHDENVFNGWFYDAECTSPVGASFAPVKDTTVYALWKVKKVITIVYNNGDVDLEVVYSEGDVVEVENPVYAKHEFKGWYTTADFVEGTEWVSGTVIEDDITIYAKWIDAEAYYNDYMPTRITDTKQEGGKGSMLTYTSMLWEINADGTGYSNQRNPINMGDLNVSNYVKETGYFTTSGVSTQYYGYVDKDTGIIITNYTTSSGLKQILLWTPFESGADISSRISTSYWLGGTCRAIQYTFDGTVYSAFVYGESVYFGATFEDENGNAVAGVDCYNNSAKDDTGKVIYYHDLIVKDKDGNVIKKFAHDGTMLQPMDGFEGSYTGEKAVTVNGVSKITIDGVEGTYAIVEDAIYTADAYVDGVYYQVTLNKADYTAVVVKPMVQIAFDTAGLADVATVEANINIAYELPVPTCDTHVFRGWYFDADLTQAVPAEFIPTGAVTVYAKWAQKVVLTIVYGDGADSITQDYASDDVVAPAVISELNGLFFQGWYLDAECTVPFTATSISENTTIYAKWSSAAPFTVGTYGDYAMAYDATTGTWASTNKEKNSTQSGITITATVVDLVVTFDWKVSSEARYDYMCIYLNGKMVAGSNKADTSGEKSGSLTFTVPAGTYIQIFYSKDSSGYKGDDILTLSNLTVNGVPVTAMN
ncbi:MAG: InlB B-repeat-containing protein [Clostridia bacterium]|nr:InlB B-repeat-containing protein [Clostridia bacterium]